MEDLQSAEDADAEPGANGESDLADDGDELEEKGSGAGTVSVRPNQACLAIQLDLLHADGPSHSAEENKPPMRSHRAYHGFVTRRKSQDRHQQNR